MYLIAWIVLGLTVGLVGSKMVQRHGKGIVLDLVLGIGGALAGGYLSGRYSNTFTNSLDLGGMLAAVAGAIVFLLINHGIRKGLADRLT